MWKVYKIECNVNHKIYIGNTKKPTNIRWNNGRGYCNQSIFYSDILKYGWENFSKEILCECNTLRESRAKEAEYIEKFNSLYPNGYNILKGTFNICGDGELLTKICQIDNNGQIKNIWDSTSKMEEYYSKNQIRTIRKIVSDAQKGILSMSLGYFWVLESDLNNFSEQNYIEHYKTYKNCSANKNNTNKIVYQYSLSGKLINSFISRREVEKENPIFKRSSVLEAIKNKRPYKNYYWSYEKLS